jgi:prepilin-type N-terminal cleavage/methylation domain-containing protein
MRTFRVRIFRKTKGFTLVELLIVVLIISIFLTFASVNWNVAAKKGKEGLLEQFSIDVALIREDAIAHYENRVVEFDLAAGTIRVGRVDLKTGFVGTGELHLQGDYRLTEALINGERFSLGKCYMTFYKGGMVDRAVLHLEGGGESYSLLVNPLTARVRGENGYVEEVSVQGGYHPS